MNKTINIIRNHFLLACILLAGSLNAIAQDNTTTESHTAHTTSETAPAANNMDWMNNPWVWVGGGVLLLLILIAIFSGKKKTSVSEVKRTTTVTTEVKND